MTTPETNPELNPESTATHNIQQAVPFLWVSDLDASLRFYLDGLSFTKTKEWIDNGKLRRCWLQREGAALMLQQYQPGQKPLGKLGEGVSICFQCTDALAIYHTAIARGLQPHRPSVGNAMWVVLFTDPDGYKLDFESPTDTPEDSIYDGSHLNGPAPQK
ncbi:VOC family protein [Granulicella sp. L60]|uniref:VOC family protein n=1 Tax=Granulicella sp. L60 TaxID=1641866 RepID=UPI00131E4D5A|nr:VOC family protein [Granulicella sp. L60]